MDKESNFNENTSMNLSIDCTKEETELFNEIDKNNNYPYLCPKCFSIPTILADFQNNIYIITCNNKHTNQYNSLKSFEENTTKNISNLLCQKCKNFLNNAMELYECNNCFLCYCSECKINHEKELSHSNFIQIKT